MWASCSVVLKDVERSWTKFDFHPTFIQLSCSRKCWTMLNLCNIGLTLGGGGGVIVVALDVSFMLFAFNPTPLCLASECNVCDHTFRYMLSTRYHAVNNFQFHWTLVSRSSIVFRARVHCFVCSIVFSANQRRPCKSCVPPPTNGSVFIRTH